MRGAAEENGGQDTEACRHFAHTHPISLAQKNEEFKLSMRIRKGSINGILMKKTGFVVLVLSENKCILKPKKVI